MRVELLIPHRLKKRMVVPEYEPELDDVRSILRDVCGELAGQTRFVIAGFGQDPWPVDVVADLSVFLEQLPRVLAAVSSSRPVVLDFYEQGIARRLRFEPAGEFYSVACTSREHWQPHPDIAIIERVALQKMLLRVRDEFMRSMRAIAPSLAGHSLIVDWLRGEHGNSGLSS
jgi:hypothetical protein